MRIRADAGLLRGVAEARAPARVAAGILLSRIAGLIRERIFAQYFGNSLFADAFRGALRMPNVLQNLLGEGTLSAAFIPIYSELIEQGREEEAGRFAGAIFGLLLVVATVLALAGILFAPILVSAFLPGFTSERRAVTVTMVRILFPMTGTLVLSAWALAVLNSHRRFFVSYVAPVLWNAAMIATLVALGAQLAGGELVVSLAWAALAGGILQFAFQVPWVARHLRRFRLAFSLSAPGVREAMRSFTPVLAARGVVQISGWVDYLLASLLTVGALSALGYAQVLYMLPISLFGMSVAAAELPELSRRRSESASLLAERVSAGLERITFLVTPAVFGYLFLGDVIVAALYQTGDFGSGDTFLVYVVLAGYTLGLLATTSARLLSSAFYALRDTRTPARIAFLRVAVAATLGLAFMFPLDRLRVGEFGLGAAGLSVATGIAAWIELALLRRALRVSIGPHGPRPRAVLPILGAGAGATVAGLLALALLPQLHAVARAFGTLIPFGVVYLGLAQLLGCGTRGTGGTGGPIAQAP
ncbi:MAG: murein biosynthesis integral membrane protein MurJ [Gemmatimonadetes bacterium]|nr:murein biosynthesis integral membrane protein MurJ [Gemmatimonadota bacterium]